MSVGPDLFYDPLTVSLIVNIVDAAAPHVRRAYSNMSGENSLHDVIPPFRMPSRACRLAGSSKMRAPFRRHGGVASHPQQFNGMERLEYAPCCAHARFARSDPLPLRVCVRARVANSFVPNDPITEW